MYTHRHEIRVRYAETDQMGYVYYGNYAQYFEVGRVEALRALGVSYKSLEAEGIQLPVLEFSIKYFKPALYDDLLRIDTHIIQLPSARILFRYETFNESGDKLNEATTTLVFVNKENGRPTKCPDHLIKALQSYF